VTLGQLFKQKRLESGRSVHQLAALTKIHIKILSAIEEDVYTDLPARAFTRGFIVNYAKALKLNPDEVMKEHHDFLEQKFAERGARDKGHQGYVFEGKELEQNRRWLVVGTSIALVFAAATLLVFKPQNHKHKEQHKEFEEEAALDDAGNPIESTPAPPTLKGTPVQVIPFAPIATTAPLSSPATSTPAPTPTGTVAAIAPSTPAPKATLTPNTTPIPPTATPIATPTEPASPETSPTPAAIKEDKLNKGDDLTAKEVKIKANFQAKDDLWVRYKSDEKPAGLIILRKDRYLVIKAKSQLLFEVSHPENIRIKTKSGYQDLTQSKVEIGPGTSLKDYSGDAFGSAPVPDEVPLPASH
jgi:cytoskeletal protein RodZ